MDSNPPIPPSPAAPAGEGRSRGSAAARLNLEAGETSIDENLGFDVELACHQQLRRLVGEIHNRIEACIPATEPVHIVFLDDAMRRALDLAATLSIQLTNLKEAYAGAADTANSALDALQVRRFEPTPSGRQFDKFSGLAAVTASSAIADAAVALLGAVRTDTRYSGRQVIVPEHAFALALAHAWESRASNPAVVFHYPTLFAPPTEERGTVMKDILTALDATAEQRKTASKALSSLLARTSRLDPSSAEFLGAKPLLDLSREQFAAAEAVFHHVSIQLEKPDEKTGLSQLQLILRAASVAAAAKERPDRTFYLFAQVVSGGGAFRTTRNFLTMLWNGRGLEHAGGCIATFGLFDSSGRLRVSDTIGMRSEYRDSRPAIEVGLDVRAPDREGAGKSAIRGGRDGAHTPPRGASPEHHESPRATEHREHATLEGGSGLADTRADESSRGPFPV